MKHYCAIVMSLLNLIFSTQLYAGVLIHTPNGTVEGSLENKIQTFLGIPYATPPVGKLRWKAPQPIKPWEGILKTTEYAPLCSQKGVLSGSFMGQEDCLYINVWAPEKKSNEALPVVIFLHGGGFAMGGTYQAGIGNNLYDGQFFAKNQQVVFVSPSYRIGAMGYLAHPSLAKENSHNISGNYGLMDMIAALKWVQKNISSFGGNPKKVFLFGQSAGAISVCALLASPQAKGLFHSAGMESGFCEYPTASDRLARGIKFAKKFDCDENDSAECMRKIPAEEIVEMSDMFIPSEGIPAPKDYFQVPWVPHVDGKIIPDQPLKLFEKGEFNSVPLLLGSTTGETVMFNNPIEIFTCNEYSRHLSKNYGKYARDVEAVYPCNFFINPNEQLMHIASDITFSCPNRRLARSFSPNQKTFRYVFNYTSLGPTSFLGPFHLLDVLFVLGTYPYFATVPTLWSANLSQTMQEFWGNMAKTNNPNGHALPKWPQYDNHRDQSILFDSDISSVQHYRQNECDLWDRISPKL